MSTVMVVAPLVIANWPAISAAVAAVVGSMGFAYVHPGRSVRNETANRAEIEVEGSEILADGVAGVAQEIVVQRDRITARFTKDERGALRVCVEGPGLSKAELQRLGEELIGRVTQQYVYHRLMTELEERNMTVIDEEVGTDRTVHIRVRAS